MEQPTEASCQYVRKTRFCSWRSSFMTALTMVCVAGMLCSRVTAGRERGAGTKRQCDTEREYTAPGGDEDASVQCAPWDGYYYEGFEYWIFSTPWIIHYLDAQKPATGEDHSLTPGGQMMFDFGDVFCGPDHSCKEWRGLRAQSS